MWFGNSKNGYQNDTCLKEIEPHAQQRINILGTTMSMLEKTCMSTRIITLISNKIFILGKMIMASTHLDLLTILYYLRVSYPRTNQRFRKNIVFIYTITSLLSYILKP